MLINHPEILANIKAEQARARFALVVEEFWEQHLGIPAMCGCGCHAFTETSFRMVPECAQRIIEEAERQRVQLATQPLREFRARIIWDDQLVREGHPFI